MSTLNFSSTVLHDFICERVSWVFSSQEEHKLTIVRMLPPLA